MQRCLRQRAFLQARCYADAKRPAVEDILVPDEGLVVLDGCVYHSCFWPLKVSNLAHGLHSTFQGLENGLS